VRQPQVRADAAGLRAHPATLPCLQVMANGPAAGSMRPQGHQDVAPVEALQPAGPQPTEEPAAAAAQPAPDVGRPSWRRFDEEQQEWRCKGDKLAASVMLVLLVVARSRTGVHDTVSAVSC